MMDKKRLKAYLREIQHIAGRGDAREESYYPVLEDLLKEYAESIGRKDIEITAQPKKTEAGNPDFRVWDGSEHIVGYIEAKKPTEELDRIKDSPQLKRYRHTFPNLILTNFFEFRLYRNGEQVDRVLIGRPFIVHDLKTVPPVEKETEFLELLDKFFSFSLPKVYDARSLAVELAKRTRFLRDEVVKEELREEEQTGRKVIAGFYEAFRDHLISGLTLEDFADLFSQTISHGLFAARSRSANGFNRKLAYDNIPHTIGILKEVFSYISLAELPKQMEWIIDDISEVLAVTDVSKLLHDYFHEGKGKDPIFHFYETFLAEYDPKTREKRGVYYTPEPVVSYIVRSLHQILKEEFGKADGFASSTVTVLDPAAGTLTFLAEAAKRAVEEFCRKYGTGGKEDFIKQHILTNFYAFELMMAPYAIGHLKMSFLLEELGYKLKEEDRFKLYLTNTLEMEELAQSALPGMSSLAEESHLAGRVKKEVPILVILGNPPYSGISANVGEWITGLIEDYKYVDGKHFGERKHWLQDDYVKFIRFAQWKLDQEGEGVLGFITNHSYLDNPTFRGMRQSLMNSFNEIYLLDLHGNTLKKEKCPDGSKDENVFDIRQGVAISLFIKKRNGKGCKIHHSEVWGLRDIKYDWLVEYDKNTTDWKELIPSSPFYFFIPREEKGREAYERYWQVTDIFPVNVTGIVTARDRFVIDFDENDLKKRISMFRNLSMQDELIKQTFKLKDTRGWKLPEARKELAKDKNWDAYFTKILYRPFDVRHIYYTQKMVDWPRPEVMRHMLKENLGLLIKRQNRRIPFSYAFVSNLITESCVFESAFANNTVCPLYRYPDIERKDLLTAETPVGKKEPNINPKLFAALNKAYGVRPTPEETFYYIYGVLYSNIYRTKYAEFLKIDFPRVPFTADYQLFKKLADHGKRLVDLHLLKSKELDPPIAKFQGRGDNKVEKVTYDQKTARVYINKDQYFEGVTKDLWEYQIGGYQVAHKWLKDRKGRRFSIDDIRHYCRIITALKKTAEIQLAIDAIYDEVENKVVKGIV